MTINPNWPWIASLAFCLAVGYAALVRWLNGHRVYGRFWSAHAWVSWCCLPSAKCAYGIRKESQNRNQEALQRW